MQSAEENNKQQEIIALYRKYFDINNDSTELVLKFLSTPLGEMIACADLKGICLLQFLDYPKLEQDFKLLQKETHSLFSFGNNIFLTQLENELNAYFDGERISFSVPLSLYGTPFQKQVWQSLQKILFGQTSTYKLQSTTMGNPLAIRAVANANSKNKIAIVIPCHRVIASDGKLSGYAGGPWRKQKLLQLESRN